MPRTKAAVAPRSDPRETLQHEGRIMTEKYRSEIDAAVKACIACSRLGGQHLRTLPAERQAAFIKGMIQEADVVFQPWAMEILYVLGQLGRARFTELQRLLGVSSRTLADKLQVLQQGQFVHREVFDEQPVRIEYRLTKRGSRTAAIGGVLFADLCPERNADAPEPVKGR